MNLKLKHKLLFLIFIPLTLSFIFITLIYNNHLNNYFKNMAIADTSHKLKVFDDRLETLKTSLLNHSKRITQDQSVIASLNLIVNYEDPNDYRYLIFDHEKRKLLNLYNSFTINDYRFAISYFDQNKKLISHSEVDRRSKENIITSYSPQGVPIYLDENNNATTLLDEVLKLDDSQNTYFMHNNKLHIQVISPLYRADEIIAHIRLVLMIDQESFGKLTQDIGENLYIMCQNSLLSADRANNYLDFETIATQKMGLHETQEKYYNFITLCKEHSNNPVYAVVAFSKESLNKELNNIIYQVTTILILVFLGLLFLIKIFMDRYIVLPLENLTESIKSLKDKNYKLLEVDSDDELGQISKKFNELSLELRNSVTSLEQSNLLLQNILDTVPMRIFIKDTQGKYLKANRYFLHDCGVKNEAEIIGKNDSELPWRKSEIDEFTKDDKDVIEEKIVLLKKEQTQTTAAKKMITVLKSKVALKDSNGEVIGLLGIYDDVTEQKEVKEQLKEKEKYLMHQSRLAQMGEMISMIAHQWRQPLAAISSTANALSLKVALSKYDEKFFQNRLENINSYSQHLSSTIDDFRNFFKKHKDMKEVSLEQLVDDSLNIITTSMENKSIEVKKDYNCFKTFKTYSNEVRQVVLNLLKNAEDVLSELESKEKWVNINTEYKEGKHILSIEDNGGGIDEKIMDKLFEPYFSTKENKDGTGLGLYMSKTIIEDHCKGKLSVSNGKFGAIFKVEL